MDPLDFLEQEELLRFFHCNKTELSCMEKPLTFVSQLRDHNFVPEDIYRRLSRMKSKENIRKSVYEILDRVEKECPQDMHRFWKCVFKDIMMNHYPTLKMLHRSLMDGSFHFDTNIPVKAVTDEGDSSEQKRLSEDEEEETNAMKKKRKRKSWRNAGDEQPGPSSQLTPVKRRRSKKLIYSSPLKKGEKGDIWTWPLYKVQLPVSCGDKIGTLKRDRYANGEKCILSEHKWFTPSEFEIFGGKSSSRNWKLSIRCAGTMLDKLIREGHLPHVNFKTQAKQKTMFRDVHLIRDSGSEDTEDEENTREEEEINEEEEEENDEDEENDQEEQSDSGNNKSPAEIADEEEAMEVQEEQPSGSNHFGIKTVFKVTCGDVTATLHKKRFASGICGRSVRTETSWMTPMEFAMETLNEENPSWRRDITCEGKPLSALIESNVLNFHSVQCECRLCEPLPEDLDDQKNDDECCICKSTEEARLVECDHCPRSFHQRCHLPHIEDSLLRDDSPWMCTFCVFRMNQASRYDDELERETVLSYRIHQHALQCQYLLLFLCSADEEHTFTEDPSRSMEDGSSLIDRPMCLSTVAGKLQENRYQTVGQFVSDVQLIFSQCAELNQDNAEILAVAEQLNQSFESEFVKAFSITE